MGNRMIKDTIRTSRTVNAMTDFQFRVWIYLITYVDDFGRGSADPELIKGLVFPRRKRLSESDIAKALADLAGMGCISLYEVSGESYFCFPNWGDHQRIQNKKSKYPAPESMEFPEIGAFYGDLPQVTVSHRDSPPEIKSNQTNPNTNPKGNLNPNARAREDGPTAAPSAHKTQKFTPPAVEEVAAYVQERGSRVDPQAFVDFYASKGWMIGKTLMKDWKAACRRAEKWDCWDKPAQPGGRNRPVDRPTPSGNNFLQHGSRRPLRISREDSDEDGPKG